MHRKFRVPNKNNRKLNTFVLSNNKWPCTHVSIQQKVNLWKFIEWRKWNGPACAEKFSTCHPISLKCILVLKHARSHSLESYWLFSWSDDDDFFISTNFIWKPKVGGVRLAKHVIQKVIAFANVCGFCSNSQHFIHKIWLNWIESQLQHSQIDYKPLNNIIFIA